MGRQGDCAAAGLLVHHPLILSQHVLVLASEGPILIIDQYDLIGQLGNLVLQGQILFDQAFLPVLHHLQAAILLGLRLDLPLQLHIFLHQGLVVRRQLDEQLLIVLPLAQRMGCGERGRGQGVADLAWVDVRLV